MSSKRSNEALWWSLFSAGGVMSALFVPVLILSTGLIVPFFVTDGDQTVYERLHGIASFWLVRVALLGIIVMTLFHCAHRIRHVLQDLGLHGMVGVLSVICYGAAFAGSVVTGFILFKL